LGFSIETGKLTLDMTINSNVSLTAAIIGSQNFRIAIISASAKVAQPNVNYNDYNDVVSKLGDAQ
jgi:hypothetical protein